MTTPPVSDSPATVTTSSKIPTIKYCQQPPAHAEAGHLRWYGTCATGDKANPKDDPMEAGYRKIFITAVLLGLSVALLMQL